MTKEIDDSMYRHTVAQRDAAWREVEYWRKRHDALLKLLTDQASRLANPPIQPMMLADPESFEAGRNMAFNEAKYVIGIDTLEGVHMVKTTRTVAGQDPVVVAMAILPEDDWK